QGRSCGSKVALRAQRHFRVFDPLLAHLSYFNLSPIHFSPDLCFPAFTNRNMHAYNLNIGFNVNAGFSDTGMDFNGNIPFAVGPFSEIDPANSASTVNGPYRPALSA